MRYCMRMFIVFCVFSCVLVTGGVAYAQTDQERITELRAQIEQLEAQAAQYRSSITSERAKANSLKKEITILKGQISAIETQIALTNKKIDKTEIEITGLEESIYDTQEKVRKQKATIGRIILFFNMQDQENLVIQLLKNHSLSDFFDQQQYAATMSSQLLTAIDDLHATQMALEQDKTSLEGKKGELEDLNASRLAQRQSLAGATKVKNSVLAQTKGQEAQYQKMLEDIEEKQAAFFKELRELETKIVSGGLYIVHVTASSVPKSAKIFQKPENDAYITQGYGCTRYARCGSSRGPYGGAPHNGVDYAAGYGSPIMAIGDGEIIANGRNDGYGNWVAIRHPNQYNLVSLYAHMSGLSPLQVGTQVTAGQTIGYEGNTGHVTGSHVHLSLYKDFFTYMHDTKSQLYFNYFEGSINPLNYL